MIYEYFWTSSKATWTAFKRVITWQLWFGSSLNYYSLSVCCFWPHARGLLITTSQYQGKIDQIKYNHYVCLLWFIFTKKAAGKPLHCSWWLSQNALALACHIADYPVHCRPAVSQISHLFKSYMCSPFSSLLRVLFTSRSLSLWSSSIHKNQHFQFLAWLDPDSVVLGIGLLLACVASFSLGFRSKQQGMRVKDHAEMRRVKEQGGGLQTNPGILKTA